MMTSDDFVNLTRISCYLYRLYVDSLSSDASETSVSAALHDASESVDNILDSYLKTL